MFELAPSSRRLRVPRNYQNAMLPQKGIQPSVNRSSPRGAGRCFRTLLYFGNNRHRQKPFGGLKPYQDGGVRGWFPKLAQDVGVQEKGRHLRGGKSTGPMERNASSAALRPILG